MAELRFGFADASLATAEMRLFSTAGLDGAGGFLMLRFPSGFKDSWCGIFGELAVTRSTGDGVGEAFGCLSERAVRFEEGRFPEGLAAMADDFICSLGGQLQFFPDEKHDFDLGMFSRD